MKYIKDNYKYILLFLFFFLSLILFGFNNTDILWNYGFSHAIRMGEIPYIDFNIITTPLYAFIMSLGLFIKDSYLVFILEQSLLLVLFYFISNKLLNGKGSILIFLLIFPLFTTLFPNYNFLVIFFITLLLYLEKNKSNDYLIGFILGLLLLTKHTIGGVILICSLISCFSIKKSLKRLVGFIIPCIIFLIYLLITNSFNDFINLSLLGIFDFGKNNNGIFIISTIITIVIFIHLIIRFIKNPKNISNYYLLGSFSLVIPIIDYFHVGYLIIIYFIIIISELDDKVIYSLNRFSIPLILATIGMNLFINMRVYGDIKFLNYNHFDGYISTNYFSKKLDTIYNEYKDGNNYMFSFSSMFYDISTDHRITYFDVPLYGNFGYNGISNMKEKIDSMHDVHFFIQKSDNRQFCVEIYDYIKDTCTKEKDIGDFEIYYKK